MSKLESLKDAIVKYLEEGHTEIYDALVIEPILQCNHGECAYCYSNSTCAGNSPLMSVMRAEEIVAILCELGIRPKQLWFAGGEPTMHRQIDYAVKAFSRICNDICIITNGYGFYRKFDSCIRLAQNPAVKEIAVTLHSAYRLVHDLLTASCDDPIWEHVPDDLSLLKTDPGARLLAYGGRSLSTDVSSFTLAQLGLRWIQDSKWGFSREDLRIAIQANMSQAMDVRDLIIGLRAQGILVNKMMIQALNCNAGRAATIPDGHRLLRWMTPTAEMVRSYLAQVREMLNSGIISEGYMIDPVPEALLEGLNAEILELYQPAPTPAISPLGVFRPNVVG